MVPLRFAGNVLMLMNKSNKKNSSNAALIIIGDEILSGKTKDANLSFIAIELNKLGIALAETRIIPDDQNMIIHHTNELREKYDYVFTTGGIGPTHDDITSQAIANAFKVPLELNEDAIKRISKYGNELTEARRKMAYVPKGSTLLENSISLAPGFKIENVFVLAGIPSIAKVMFFAAIPHLKKSKPILSVSHDFYLKEGDFSLTLANIANDFSELSIGSYPFSKEGKYGAAIVIRGTDEVALDACMCLVKSELDKLIN
jgi:molybdenum cofactor synthesis domain-containing protein